MLDRKEIQKDKLDRGQGVSYVSQDSSLENIWPNLNNTTLMH